jgi:hypothetical protein
MPGLRAVGSEVGKSPVRWISVAALAVAGFLAMMSAGNLLAAEAPKGYRSSAAETERSVVPRVFKVDIRKGYVMYVFPILDWQVVSVLIERRGRGRFGVQRGVYYTVGSESGEGEADAWPDLSAKVEAGAVSAHFGPLGSIDMQFVPSGGSRRYRPYCGGESVALARGRYEGSIRFAGGHGYPSVEASVAQAAPASELRSRCTGGVAEGPPTLPGAQLQAGSIRSNTPSFSAFKNAPNGLSYIGGGISEFQRGVGIIRFAALVAPSSAFQYSQSLNRATVRPPAPFSGVGFYGAERDRRHRWSGDLAVDLPGRENVSLTHAPLRGFINPARWIPFRPRKHG